MEKPILAAMLSIARTELNDKEKFLLEKANPLGITLFGRNIKNKKQLQKLTKEIKETIGREDILIAVDQEGGRIRRLAEPDFRSYAAQAELGVIDVKSGAKTAERAMRYHAALIGKDLVDVGINWNFAPVLDIAYNNTTTALKSRCFGNDEKKTAIYGQMMIEEYQKVGICPCIKHMPGHGRAVNDPHLGLPVLNSSLKELEKDFYPFRYNNQAPAGMTAHIQISAIDNVQPVTQSAKAIETLIRGIIGFDGFLISDAIDMHALKGSLTEKAQKSLNAGCDAVCYCMGEQKGLEELAASCRFMDDKSLIRFAKIKNIINNGKREYNYKQIAEEYQKIIGEIEKYDERYDATETLHKMKSLNNKEIKKC